MILCKDFLFVILHRHTRLSLALFASRKYVVTRTYHEKIRPTTEKSPDEN